MRPKILEIEGLQSFQDKQHIDFDTLGETGLFGIFGPTGSGKSTVLDAITFALYGRVKRAERGTQGIINISRDIARVSFSFELQKNGKRSYYRVERTYQRKKGSENSCEPKIARLIEISDNGEIPLCDKASEIGNSIEELIGLNHDDFTRAVVLPQNSFQEFLLLDNSKKRAMLERIFYLEEYGTQLWDRFSAKLSALKSRIDLVTGELSAYSDATDEALKEAEKAMEAAFTERKLAENKLLQLESIYNESKEIWLLSAELSIVEKREAEHEANKSSIDGKKILLDRAKKAIELQPLILAASESASKLKETAKKLEETAEQIPKAAEALEILRNKHNELKIEASEKQPYLVERRAKLKDALVMKKEIDLLFAEVKELVSTSDKQKLILQQKSQNAGKAAKELDELEKKISAMNTAANELKINPEYRNHIQEG